MGLSQKALALIFYEFLSAEEVFTATTAGGPVPVTRVNKRILCNDTPGPLAEKITQTYWDWHERDALTETIEYQS